MIVIMKASKAVLSLFQSKQLISGENAMEYLETFSDEKYQPVTVDIDLKHSIYNIVKHKRKTYLIYNTLFNSMITMSDSEYRQYENIKFSDLFLVEALADNGFIIPEFTDEYQRYEYYQKILNAQLHSDTHYTLALTSRCNAKCVYCYEEGVQQVDMSLETVKKITDLLCKSEKPIDITWFGGEPLLKIDYIEYITKKLQENNQKFDSGIITNGSLLTEDMIVNKFPEWGINWIQISLDGMKDEYLRRKCYCSSRTDIFENLIFNIECLVKNNISVSIRLNMDSANSEECVHVAEYLKEKFSDSDNILAYPAFLAGKSYGIDNEERRIFYSQQVYRIYPPSKSLLTDIPKINSCYLQQKGAFVIDTDGSILCCERDIGRQKTKIASVQEIDDIDSLKKSVFPPIREQCKVCAYYPKCLGGCIATHNSSCKYDACFMERYKTEYLLDKIIDF